MLWCRDGALDQQADVQASSSSSQLSSVVIQAEIDMLYRVSGLTPRRSDIQKKHGAAVASDEKDLKKYSNTLFAV